MAILSGFSLSYKNGVGGCCQNAQKQFIIKTYKELILYKPEGKYQFTRTCIGALVMIVFQVINCLISQPNHRLWVLKRTVTNSMRQFFWAQNYRLNLMRKKMYDFTVKNCVCLEYVVYSMQL